MRTRFDNELKQMNDDIIEVGSYLEQSFSKISSILNNFEDSSLKEIKKYAKKTHSLEREIQVQALNILCSQQPVARDLRLVSSIINIVVDMERIADQILEIALIIMNFKDAENLKRPESLIKMIENCSLMIKTSIDSLVNQDKETAIQVIVSDDEVDNLFTNIRLELIDIIKKNKDNAEKCIDFIMIAKYLERIADHSVNISQWVIFSITGKHRRKRLM